jgi:hypothetical protein
MMTLEEYYGRVQALVERVEKLVPAGRLQEVHKLVDHGEPAEGLCSLAWVIATDRVLVPRDLIESIYEYTEELVPREFLPSDLDEYGVDEW